MNIRLLEAGEVEKMIPFLLLAEPSEFALRWSLDNMSDAVYGMEIDGEWVGAATVRWQSEPSEVLELGIAPDHQRKGLGKQLLVWLVDEAKRREKPALVVGTSNASVGNILFYQKCGFRMDHVRVDYLRYYRKPRYENEILVRDLLVFKMDLAQPA